MLRRERRRRHDRSRSQDRSRKPREERDRSRSPQSDSRTRDRSVNEEPRADLTWDRERERLKKKEKERELPSKMISDFQILQNNPDGIFLQCLGMLIVLSLARGSQLFSYILFLLGYEAVTSLSKYDYNSLDFSFPEYEKMFYSCSEI